MKVPDVKSFDNYNLSVLTVRYLIVNNCHQIPKLVILARVGDPMKTGSSGCQNEYIEFVCSEGY